MKKYKLFLLSILLLITCFLLGWYGDRLASTALIIHAPLIILILLGCFVALLVACIVAIIRRRSYINFFSIGVLCLLVILILKFPFRDTKVKYELDHYEADRLKIVDLIKDGQLTPDPLGNVDLPWGLRRVSASGQALVLQNDDRGQVVAFWIFRGIMLSGSIFLVYSSGGEELIRASQEGPFITRIERLRDSWYYVVTDC